MQNNFAVSFFLVRFQTCCIVDTTFVKQKTIIFFRETDFIAFQQSKSSFVVARNNFANEIDQTGFILTEIYKFGKVTWNFRSWGVNHET